MLYCLKRICDPCKEHVDNKFTPLSERATNEFIPVRDEMTALMARATEVLANKDYTQTDALLREGALLKIRFPPCENSKWTAYRNVT